ncbi:MAG: type II toxin-antitoxin system MqsR family toxin [Clostridia bacterium]|nr:type II toxin-antitoxin system MqsR family toxin [Clostridia bacterium]
MQSSDLKWSVEELLKTIKKVTQSKDFDIDRNFDFRDIRLCDDPADPNNNRNTMLALGYNIEDVLEEIKRLEITDFYRIKPDYKPGSKKPFFEFIKVIRDRQVYIKIKTKEWNDNIILCVSFHFQDQYVNDSKFPFR